MYVEGKWLEVLSEAGKRLNVKVLSVEEKVMGSLTSGVSSGVADIRQLSLVHCAS